MLKKTVIISPHRDDAVISTGDFVLKNYRDIIVLNVFPVSTGTILKMPDKKVSAYRKKEDKQITGKYGFKFIDSKFKDTSLRGVRWDDDKTSVDKALLKEIQDWISSELINIKETDDIFIPAAYGLHPDHYLCTLAFSSGQLHQVMQQNSFKVYCDQQYYYEGKAFHQGHKYLEKQGRLFKHRFNPKKKRRMVSVYKSQLTSKRIDLLTRIINFEYYWETDATFFLKSKIRDV